MSGSFTGKSRKNMHTLLSIISEPLINTFFLGLPFKFDLFAITWFKFD